MTDRLECLRCGAPAEAGAELCSQCGAALRPKQAFGADAGPAAPSGPGVTLEAGRDLGPYRLERKLGEGGFAQVWEAENRDTGRRVALKVLTELRTDSTEAIERFRQEGRLAASISHPRCVYIFAAEEFDGVPVISMELMPGGTLADRLEEGRPSTEQAVDYVLNLIDGLEAGQRLGIIHRDVKPSNCFLDDQGGVRIGDFGISKSLEADARLTVTGSFLGTPHYASPEQVSGEPLDVRADLYSVGVVLYELLTGALPFAGTSASQVLAHVLTKEPISFQQHPIPVPRGLQHIVLRLLAKDKEKRFPDYETLRNALAPYSSVGLRPGGRLRRFGAIVIDFLVFVPVAVLAGVAGVGRSLTAAALASLGTIVLQIVYFGLMEGLTGRSVGKWLLRLQVVQSAADGDQLSRSFLRAAVFLLIYQLPTLVLQTATLTGGSAESRELLSSLSTWGNIVAALILASTMRKANGYAGLHELASGTRVVDVEREQRSVGAPSERSLNVSSAAPTGLTQLGPYKHAGTVWQTDGEAFVIGQDEDLKRDVWIHLYRDSSTAPPLERLRVRREGSLPWLQRSESDGWQWDAYGAPRGTGLATWVRERGPLSWKEMRPVIDSLARELAERIEQQGSAGTLSLSHLWIEDDGHAVLLDFPTEPEPQDSQDIGAGNALDYLRRATTFALQGEADDGAEAPRVPLPEPARVALGRLYGEGDAVGSVAEFVQLIAPLNRRPVEVSQFRRLGSFGVSALPPSFMVLMVLLLPIVFATVPVWYQDIAVRLEPYHAELNRIDSLQASGAQVDSTMRRTAESIWIVLAEAKLQSDRNPQLTNTVSVNVEPEEQALLDSAVALYPDPDAAAVAEAREWLEERVDRSIMEAFGPVMVPTGLAIAFFILGISGIAGVVLAFVFRGPVLLHLFGIAVQRTDGAPAARWRCFVRSLVAWSPLIALVFVSDLDATVLDILLIAAALAGAGWSILRPERGPADRLMGTVLVPK
jgi:hypothetical protein